MEDARAIAAWSYEPPYDVYNMAAAADPGALESDASFLLDKENAYFAVFDADGTLAGSCCFGAEARVPGGDYSRPMLDIGWGMRPSLTGLRRGPAFSQAILAFARAEFETATFRATVATFNVRSIRVLAKAGFVETETFASTTDTPREFVIMVAI